jgi:hypothetical protein
MVIKALQLRALGDEELKAIVESIRKMEIS